MNLALENAVATVAQSFYWLAIAVVVLGALSAIAARSFGGRTRTQCRATAKVVFAIGMDLYALIFYQRSSAVISSPS